MPRLLSAAEVEAGLAALPGWSQRDGALRATFTFRDFAAAFTFMTWVAAEAERRQHHPDWRNVWSKVEISLSTHDAGGITAKDLDLARAIQLLARPTG